MTKPTKWVCAQRRLRSAWASAQSDQNLRCPQEESFGPYLPIKRTVKTLIRLGGCPGWSESSLGAQSLCWFCHEVAHIRYQRLICSFGQYCHFWQRKKKKDQTGTQARASSFKERIIMRKIFVSLRSFFLKICLSASLMEA